MIEVISCGYIFGGLICAGLLLTLAPPTTTKEEIALVSLIWPYTAFRFIQSKS